MTAPFVVTEHPACGCAPDSDSLRKSGYIDGPIVSAVIDLARWGTFDKWKHEILTFHGKGTGCQIKRAEKLGATYEAFEKANWLEDWVAIDLSKDVRQGRPMSAGYRQTLEERGGAPTEWKELQVLRCPFHWRRCAGIFVPCEKRTIAGREVEKRLVSYVSTIRTGNLMILSMILGHGDYLSRGVVPAMLVQTMRALFARGTEDKGKAPPIAGIEGVLYGGFHDGGEGLRHFKTRFGFEPRRMVSAVAAPGGTR